MSDNEKNTINVVVAEDDKDDYEFLKTAFEDEHLNVNIVWTRDGEELMTYLLKGGYRESNTDKFPIILLDLNMPKKDGRQALEEIKNNPILCVIPVIVFTTSNAPNDLRHVYRLGASAYVMKPNSYQEFINFVKSFKTWLERISLPFLETPT